MWVLALGQGCKWYAFLRSNIPLLHSSDCFYQYQPIIAVQAAMDGEALASGIAFMVFSQAIGPAIANTLYNVIFLSSLPTQIAKFAPHANVQAIIDAGASGFRPVVSPADLNGVLIAY